MHEKGIFTLVRNEAGIARSEISRRIGLSKSTTERIIRSLVARGILNEAVRDDKTRQGRRGIPLSVNASRPCVVGVDMNADAILAAGLNLLGKILLHGKAEICTRMSSEEILARIIEPIEKVLDGLQAMDRPVAALGFGDVGVVDSKKGVSLFSSPLPNWKDVPIAEHLNARFGLPVYVQDSSRLQCLAEAHYGVGKGVDGLLFIDLGVGIGMGVYGNGRLYSGEQGSGCEIGHVVVQPDGPICSCGGRGCLEAVAGSRALAAQAVDALRKGGQSRLSAMVDGNLDALTAEHVYEAAEAKDRLAMTLVGTASEILGVAVANICNLFNPVMVVLGGDMAKHPALWEPVKKIIRRTAMPWIAAHMTVEFSSMPEHGGVRGAGELAIENLFLAGSKSG